MDGRQGYMVTQIHWDAACDGQDILFPQGQTDSLIYTLEELYELTRRRCMPIVSFQKVGEYDTPNPKSIQSGDEKK